MDKYKDIGIRLENLDDLYCPQEVAGMAERNPDLLNTVYKEISEALGMEAAMAIYQLYKGRQISFPTRFFNPEMIHEAIVREYDGTNIPLLARKYNYSEKSIRRILKSGKDRE